jgi:hypothetical protein
MANALQFDEGLERRRPDTEENYLHALKRMVNWLGCQTHPNKSTAGSTKI